MALTKVDINAGTTSNLSGSRSLPLISTRISGSFTAPSSSFSTRVSNLKSDSGSFSTRVLNLKTDSGSFSTRVSNLKTDSGSFSTRVSNLKTDSGSFSTRVTPNTLSGSLLAGTGNIQGLGTTNAVTFASVTATGNITAQEFHMEFVSASILHTSGSTKFGDTALDDIHQFTGSLQVTGSGNHYFQTGKVGIGTTSPGVELEIVGSVSASVSGSFGVLKTGDLELENKRGHWRIVEESEYLSVYNVNTNKKYKFVLEEIE